MQRILPVVELCRLGGAGALAVGQPTQQQQGRAKLILTSAGQRYCFHKSTIAKKNN
jgi:hypothetical protein